MAYRIFIFLIFPVFCYGQKIPKTEKSLHDTLNLNIYYELKNTLETMAVQGLASDTIIHCNRMDTIYSLLHTLNHPFTGIIYSTNTAQEIIEINVLRPKNVVQLKARFSNLGYLIELVYPVGNGKWSELAFFENQKISMYKQKSSATLYYVAVFLGDGMSPGINMQFFENGRLWFYYYWNRKPETHQKNIFSQRKAKRKGYK